VITPVAATVRPLVSILTIDYSFAADDGFVHYFGGPNEACSILERQQALT
jgi:hypothetical protein